MYATIIRETARFSIRSDEGENLLPKGMTDTIIVTYGFKEDSPFLDNVNFDLVSGTEEMMRMQIKKLVEATGAKVESGQALHELLGAFLEIHRRWFSIVTPLGVPEGTVIIDL